MSTIYESESDLPWAYARNPDMLATLRDRDRLRAELAASEALVTALQEQMARLAEQHARAVAKAREEQREACAKVAQDNYHAAFSVCVLAVRATPLDSTPLAARIAELECAANQALEALGWLAFEADRAGLDLSESDHPTWREDIRALLAAPRELRVMECGHHISNLNRSVETGVYFCDACRSAEMLRDALTAESSLRSERDSLKSALAAEREKFALVAKDHAAFSQEVERVCHEAGVESVAELHEEALKAHERAEKAESALAAEVERHQATANALAETRERTAQRIEGLLTTPLANESFKEGVRRAASRVRVGPTYSTVDDASLPARGGR